MMSVGVGSLHRCCQRSAGACLDQKSNHNKSTKLVLTFVSPAEFNSRHQVEKENKNKGIVIIYYVV